MLTTADLIEEIKSIAGSLVDGEVALNACEDDAADRLEEGDAAEVGKEARWVYCNTALRIRAARLRLEGLIRDAGGDAGDVKPGGDAD